MGPIAARVILRGRDFWRSDPECLKLVSDRLCALLKSTLPLRKLTNELLNTYTRDNDTVSARSSSVENRTHLFPFCKDVAAEHVRIEDGDHAGEAKLAERPLLGGDLSDREGMADLGCRPPERRSVCSSDGSPPRVRSSLRELVD
jgi:hypothetical protein